MTPNEFLKSKGYGTEGHVTRSRKVICKLMQEYEQNERDVAYKQGYNDAISDAIANARVKITYNPNFIFGQMPEIKECAVDLYSILRLTKP